MLVVGIGDATAGGGTTVVTITQLLLIPLVTLVTVTLPAALVNATGKLLQLAFDCPAWLVMDTDTVHDDAPAGTCRLDTVMMVPPAAAVVAATALAHVPPTDGGDAICSPDGNESTNPTLLSAELPAGLETVNVNVVVPPDWKVVGLNDLVSVGVSGVTITQLLLTPLVTLVTVTLPAPLVNAVGELAQLGLVCPGWLVMDTVTVHVDAPAGTARLVTVISVPPAAAVVAATALVHVPPTAGGDAISSPDGSESTKPTLVNAGLPAGLLTVNVNVVVPPAEKVVGLNDLVSVGVSVVTMTQLLLTPLVTLVTVTLPGPLVNATGRLVQLGFTCPGLLVMDTVTVQEDAPAGTCKLATVMAVPPAAAVVAATALVQVPPTAGGAAICSPDGNESTNPTLVSAGLPAGLVTVNVNVVVPPDWKVVGLNDLVSVGVSVVTVTQLLLTPLVTLVTVTLPEPLVNAAGTPAQSGFT